MTRFVIASLLWFALSFAMLWWVQTAMHAMHRDAAVAVDRVTRLDPLPEIAEGQIVTEAVAEALFARRAAPEDMARVEAGRLEVTRRLRMLWIVLTLVPLLVGAWWVVKGIEPKAGKANDAD